ncbi:MAG: hypothetical protein STSR0009_00550 [Methanoregula sp.]
MFGESAGAVSIIDLLTSTMSTGLHWLAIIKTGCIWEKTSVIKIVKTRPIQNSMGKSMQSRPVAQVRNRK